MSKIVPNPTRLAYQPENEDALGIGRMFRNARELPDEELPRLHWRLRTSQRLRAMRPRLVLRVAVVTGVVFCMGGVVGAVVSPFWARKQPTVVAPATPAAKPAAKPRKPHPATSSPPSPPSPPSPSLPATSEPPEFAPDETPSGADDAKLIPVEPAPSASTLASGAPQPVLAPVKHRSPFHVAMLNQPAPLPIQVPAIPPPPVASSRIAVEQALLGQAMKVLREGHDAPTALALLAQHAERFPEGALASEASMVRVEALLALGRRSEALSALDGIALASLPNRDERFVARGELRATDGRWSEAQQDFDQALRSHNLPATSTKARNIQERALWGRAAARSRLGDQAGARADLELYLRHYPSGKFAGPASSLLKGVP